MRKVLLVDDEPFILQGLQVVIDWEQEGFEIAGVVNDGQEALEFLKKEPVDLIVADINMPVMTGIELLQIIRENNISDAYFVILSGYAEFSYAQKAMKYQCTEYILKPVEREELLRILREVNVLKATTEVKQEEAKMYERAYLARNMLAVIQGKYDQMNLSSIQKHLRLSEELRYIEILLDDGQYEDEVSDEEKRGYQRKLLDACSAFLKQNEDHCFFDMSGEDKIYDIGFVYCDYMATEAHQTETGYLENFQKYLSDVAQLPVVMLVGKKVSNISALAKSYGTAFKLRSFQGFHSKKKIYYYEEEVQVVNSNTILCKKSIDKLLLAIEHNKEEEIGQAVDDFFEEMHHMGENRETYKLNINYILFQLIHLASEQDSEVNQEEILHRISEQSFEVGFNRGSREHVLYFAKKYAQYLSQLRKKVSKGVLGEVEREIKEHYMENLTLKDLSEKYYVNSAYLGQLFRKKYDCSFKDYLNQYRMEQAAHLLLHSDMKTYEIAEAVGYHDIDYFVNRFIQVKGCTPAKYRKEVG